MISKHPSKYEYLTQNMTTITKYISPEKTLKNEYATDIIYR